MPENLRMRFKTNFATRSNRSSPTTYEAQSCPPTALFNRHKKTVYLVDLVCLVCLVERNKSDQPSSFTPVLRFPMTRNWLGVNHHRRIPCPDFAGVDNSI